MNMKKILALALSTLLLFGVVSCDSEQNDVEDIEFVEDTDYYQLTLDDDHEIVTISTTMGDIKLQLFPEKAPKAVENFITHAENGYYDDVIFHRVIKDFMIQTGDPDGTGMGGESIWGSDFENEWDGSLYHFDGTIAMANAGPNTNGSQFYIVSSGVESMTDDMKAVLEGMGYDSKTIEKYMSMGGSPWLDGGAYTAFGQVIDGMEVVYAINSVETGLGDRPVKEVKIKSITVE